MFNSGLTGGLAAPLVATGAGVIIGAGAASGIATNVGIAVLASIFGATGAGLAGEFCCQKKIFILMNNINNIFVYF